MPTFKGGEKLEAFLRDMSERVTNPATLRVGFLENSKYPDGTPTAMVAAIQDFGAPKVNIPPRPFFRNVVINGSLKWGAELANILKAVGYDATRALGLMGEMIKGEIKDSINNGSYAPLKPATVRRKGFDKPLIDTGHLINSVDAEVK